MSIAFVGNSTESINHGSAASLDDLQTWTLAIWINVRDWASFFYVVRKGRSGNEDKSLALNNGTGNMTSIVRRSGVNDNLGAVTIPHTTGWIFVAETYAAAGTSGQRIKLYSGDLVSPVQFVGQGGAGTGTVTDASQNLWVGASNGGNSAAFDCAWMGYWNRVFSLWELEELRRQSQYLTPSIFRDSTCVLDCPYLPRNDGVQLDRSRYGNHGTPSSAAILRGNPFPWRVDRRRRFHLLEHVAAAPGVVSLRRRTLTMLGAGPG